MVKLPTFRDTRGNLTVWDKDVPFIPKRVFWIYDVPAGFERGKHSHERCEQVIFAVHGSFMVNDRRLYNPALGLHIPTGVEVRLWDFSPGAVALVLCSEHYDPDEVVK